jgi:hypothetical protein
MFAKMLIGAAKENRHVGVPRSIVEGEHIEFSYDLHGRPFMKVWRFGSFEELPVFGDVYLMSGTGETIDRFSPPLNFVGRDADGWKDLADDAKVLSHHTAAPVYVKYVPRLLTGVPRHV